MKQIDKSSTAGIVILLAILLALVASPLLFTAGITGSVAYKGYAISYCRECTSGSYYYIPADPQYSYTITDDRGRVWTNPTANTPKYPYGEAGLAQAKARIDTIISQGITSPTQTATQNIYPQSTPTVTTNILSATQCAATYSQYRNIIDAANTNRDNTLTNQEATAYISSQYFASIVRSEGYIITDFTQSGCEISETPQGVTYQPQSTLPAVPTVVETLPPQPPQDDSVFDDERTDEKIAFGIIGIIILGAVVIVFRGKK